MQIPDHNKKIGLKYFIYLLTTSIHFEYFVYFLTYILAVFLQIPISWKCIMNETKWYLDDDTFKSWNTWLSINSQILRYIHTAIVFNSLILETKSSLVRKNNNNNNKRKKRKLGKKLENKTLKQSVRDVQWRGESKVKRDSRKKFHSGDLSTMRRRTVKRNYKRTGLELTSNSKQKSS